MAAAAAALCLSDPRPDMGLTPAAAAALMLDAPVRIKLETVEKEFNIDTTFRCCLRIKLLLQFSSGMLFKQGVIFE